MLHVQALVAEQQALGLIESLNRVQVPIDGVQQDGRRLRLQLGGEGGDQSGDVLVGRHFNATGLRDRLGEKLALVGGNDAPETVVVGQSAHTPVLPGRDLHVHPFEIRESVLARFGMPSQPLPRSALRAAAAVAKTAARGKGSPSASASAYAPWKTSPQPVVSRACTCGAGTRVTPSAVIQALPSGPGVTATTVSGRRSPAAQRPASPSPIPVNPTSPSAEKMTWSASPASPTTPTRSAISKSSTRGIPRARAWVNASVLNGIDHPSAIIASTSTRSGSCGGTAAGARRPPACQPSQRRPAASTSTAATGVRPSGTTDLSQNSTPASFSIPVSISPVLSSPVSPHHVARPPSDVTATAAVAAIPPPLHLDARASCLPSPAGNSSISRTWSRFALPTQRTWGRVSKISTPQTR